ncbi:hypothetical protein WN944_006809 [Citrus x changshan-huyou]|uniref:Uncharacterized protein n=1 Tax=Citrus x changshan-huyou TaxID=2935761 RepID=A0AAP0MR91_9ROSI
MPGFGKSIFAKKRRAKRLGSECSHCVRLACKNPCCKALGMVSVNREDKIKFVKDGMSKESLDDMLRSLETHPSGYVQREIQNLWKLFQKESAHFSLENLTLKDSVCQFIRKLDGKSILDPYRAFKSLLDVKPEEDVSHNHNYHCFRLRKPSARHHSKSLKTFRMTGEELVVSTKKLFIYAPSANELLDFLQAYKPEPDPMTLALDWATDDDGSNSRKKCKLDLTLRL